MSNCALWLTKVHMSLSACGESSNTVGKSLVPRVPRVLDWSQVEQAIAGETRPRERAILISLRVPRRFHVRGKGNKDRVVVLTRLGAQALAKYLETRATAPSDAALFVTTARRPRASADVPA